jgi:CxxC motif-containing protein (DUF1111 family)
MRFAWRCVGPFSAGLGLLLLGGCEDATPAPEVHGATAAAAMAGISPEESAQFIFGRTEFLEAETPAAGIGPLFNGNSCAGCHNSGGVGGPGVLTVARAACRSPDGSLADPPGGSLVFLFSTRPDLANASVPANCNTLARRRTTNILGLGLIEAIPDEAIVAASLEPKPAGVLGRVAMVMDMKSKVMRVGRFGWKAQHASLDVFAADAYRNEMGITNELFPTENAPGGNVNLLKLMDPTPDPEAKLGVVAALASFMRFSTAPVSVPQTPEMAAGAALFASVGCASCHRPSYQTGSAMGPSLANHSVGLYSDLLLHDVGTGDSIVQGAATGAEFRTPPLWGLSRNVGLMHDGRAGGVADAIADHAGEALGVKAAYMALSDAERSALLSFVSGL